MSETTWTPGPWKMFDAWGPFEPDGLHRVARVGGAGGHTVIETPGEDMVVSAANAHLIAAAPELYRELEKLEWIACECVQSNGYHEADCGFRVLAKARGENPYFERVQKVLDSIEPRGESVEHPSKDLGVD